MGQQWLHGWPVAAEVRAERTSTIVVLVSRGGVGDAESAEAAHKELKHVMQKDSKINFEQSGGIR